MALRMPVIFFGHGNPMNAISKNEYTQAWSALGKKIPKPKAILVISAHWYIRALAVTSMAHPRTIHDFRGFPEELFQFNYPAPGDLILAQRVQEIIPASAILDEAWGLDHGTWSVLAHVFPRADIPVVQLSIDASQPALFHYELGRKFSVLREEGVLIVGSGNIVHNLREIKWEADAKPYNWAIEFDEWARLNILKRNYSALIADFHQLESGKLSVPTYEHYYPMLYVLGASNESDELCFDCEGIQNGSISMRSMSFGAK